MVDFRLSTNDTEILEQVRREGLAVRKHARYFDDHEEELPPQKLPEADSFPSLNERVMRSPADDTPAATFQMLLGMARQWGDTFPLRQPPVALGNAALQAAGTPEQKERWAATVLSMATSEPGCGSDAKAIKTTARRDGDHWVISGK